MNDNSPPSSGYGSQRARREPPTDEDNGPSNSPCGGRSQASTTTREDRRGWANCFATTKSQDWMADFTGVMTMEDGSKFWVNVYKKLDRKRERYVAVSLKPWGKKP